MVNSGHNLDKNRSYQLPKFLVGDSRRLKQVLINLVKNALKFTQQGKIEIKVCYKTDLNLLVIHVCDTGVGIAAEDFPKLFTRFGKLQRTAEMNHEGIGLGLTIVKQIVELNQGEISVHSDGTGLGSTFCFTMQMDQIDESNYLLDDKEIFKEGKGEVLNRSKSSGLDIEE